MLTTPAKQQEISKLPHEIIEECGAVYASKPNLHANASDYGKTWSALIDAAFELGISRYAAAGPNDHINIQLFIADSLQRGGLDEKTADTIAEKACKHMLHVALKRCVLLEKSLPDSILVEHGVNTIVDKTRKLAGVK